VRRTWCVWLCLFIFGVMCSAAQRGSDESSPGEKFLGAWTGTWEGSGSGGFELTLEKGKEGAMAGRVSVTGEPTYKATFKTLSFDGNKMSAKYDFPPDKASATEIARGTWTVSTK